MEVNALRLALHWKGGDHTALDVPKNRPGQHRWKTSVATKTCFVTARTASDASIASILNRLAFAQRRISPGRPEAFRSDQAVAVHREGERAERGEVNLGEAAALLGVSKMTVTRLVKDGVLAAKAKLCGCAL